jgi:hypothetical protein
MGILYFNKSSPYLYNLLSRIKLNLHHIAVFSYDFLTLAPSFEKYSFNESSRLTVTGKMSASDFTYDK